MINHHSVSWLMIVGIHIWQKDTQTQIQSTALQTMTNEKWQTGYIIITVSWLIWVLVWKSHLYQLSGNDIWNIISLQFWLGVAKFEYASPNTSCPHLNQIMSWNNRYAIDCKKIRRDIWWLLWSLQEQRWWAWLL